MKTIITFFLVIVSNTLFAQYSNLNLLPDSIRNKALVEIAYETIDLFSIGYLRPGNKPFIEDIGIITEEKCKNNRELPYEKEYIGRYIYAVYYKGTPEEHSYYNYTHRNYLVKAYILADIGKVTTIRYIDDDGWMLGSMEKISDNEKRNRKNKRKFVTVSERRIIDEANKPKPIKYITDSEINRAYERRVAREDSIKRALIKRAYERRVAKEDSIKRGLIKQQ